MVQRPQGCKLRPGGENIFTHSAATTALCPLGIWSGCAISQRSYAPQQVIPQGFTKLKYRKCSRRIKKIKRTTRCEACAQVLHTESERAQNLKMPIANFQAHRREACRPHYLLFLEKVLGSEENATLCCARPRTGARRIIIAKMLRCEVMITRKHPPPPTLPRPRPGPNLFCF